MTGPALKTSVRTFVAILPPECIGSASNAIEVDRLAATVDGLARERQVVRVVVSGLEAGETSYEGWQGQSEKSMMSAS